MTQREIIRITLFSDSEMHATIAEAAEWLAELAAEVPPEYRDTSTFEVETESARFGDYLPIFRAYYDRPETDEEYTKRQDSYRRSVEQTRALNERREREIYEQLKRKFGGAA